MVFDATTPRRADSDAAALDRLRDYGIEVATAEMVLFEWLGCAATEGFRELSRLIR